MEFNGQDAKDLKLFGDIDINSLPVELDETPVNNSTRVDITQSNISANIPRRFFETTFNDIESSLKDKVKPFCLEPNNDKVFLLFGNVGLGKTSAMAASIHERAIKGMDSGLYFSVRMLSPTLRTCRSYSAKENEEMFYRRLSTVSYLCLDEVGTCPNVAEEREFLTTVLSARFDNMLPTFIATNLSVYKFKYLITGVDYSEKTSDEQRDLCKKLDVTNPVLNRIKSVAIAHTVVGESYRTRG